MVFARHRRGREGADRGNLGHRAEKPRLKPAFLARDARIVPDFVAMHEQKDWQLWAQAPDQNRERQQIDMA